MKKSWILIVLFFFAISAYAASANNQYQKGKKAYEKGEYSEAISYFKKATESDPQQGDFFIMLGAAYCKNGQFKEAVDACQQSLNLPHAKDMEQISWAVLAFANVELGRFDAAILSKKKSIELLPNDSDNFVELSKLYNDTQQYDEAITAAKRAIELKADNASAYNNLGYAYRMKKHYNEAFNAFKKAIEIDPVNALYRSNMGDLFYDKKDYAETIEAYKKAVELQPANIDYLMGIAMTYRLMGKYDDAIAAANRAIELETNTGVGVQNGYKNDKSAAFSFGIRSLLNRYKRLFLVSFNDAEKAYSLDSTSIWAQLSLGAAYLDRGQYDETIKLLSKLEGPMALLLEATAYAKQGKEKEAANIYISIPEEELSPKNIPLMNDRMALLQIFKPIVKEHRDKAQSFEAQGQYQEVLSELSEALKIADEIEARTIQESIFSIVGRAPSLSGILPEEARECVLRGEMLVKEGDFEKAAGEYKKAIQIAPYAARLYYNSALIYAELKKYPEALRQMKLYLKAASDAPDARAAKDEIYKWEFMMEKEK